MVTFFVPRAGVEPALDGLSDHCLLPLGYRGKCRRTDSNRQRARFRLAASTVGLRQLGATPAELASVAVEVEVERVTRRETSRSIYE
jgi:hypothetical protein